MTNTLIQVFISLFFTILFLQSGLDKFFDWKGNLEFHTEHFSKTLLKNFTIPMLLLLASMETVCGAACSVGAVYILAKSDSTISFYGVSLAAIILLMLFFGQRVSKDYRGAATLVPYFILSILGLFFLQ